MGFIRRRPCRVVLSTGELLNMLGRAGRPGQVEAGWGVSLFVDFPSRHGGTTATLAENHRSAPSVEAQRSRGMGPASSSTTSTPRTAW